MALIQCSECGREVSDKAKACPYCGNPIASLFEKPEPATAQDDTEEVMRYLSLARRARNDGNHENAAKYYDLVMQRRPLNWEAAFYQVYHTAQGCKIINIPNACYSVANCFDSVLALIKENEEPSKKHSAYGEVVSRSIGIAKDMASVGRSQYERFSNLDSALGEYGERVVAAEAILSSLTAALNKQCPDERELIAQAAEADIDLIVEHIKALKKDWAKEAVQKKAENVKAVNPNYTAPEIGGCYVATCVYGSYDCPEVWTLRRFRDNTLKSSSVGRTFIRLYYRVSPALVRRFGSRSWFVVLCHGPLNLLVHYLQTKGVSSTPYQDRNF